MYKIHTKYIYFEQFNFPSSHYCSIKSIHTHKGENVKICYKSYFYDQQIKYDMYRLSKGNMIQVQKIK